MKNNFKNQSNRTNNSLPLISPADSGFSFSASSITSFLVSLVYTIVISAIASSKEMTAIQYSEAMQSNYLFNVVAYLLSAVGLVLTLSVIAIHKKQPLFFGLPTKKTPPKLWIAMLLLTFGLLFGFSELNNIFISSTKRSLFPRIEESSQTLRRTLKRCHV